MRRFCITIYAARVGKVQHVLRAADKKAAEKRMRKAHPNCEILEVVEPRR